MCLKKMMMSFLDKHFNALIFGVIDSVGKTGFAKVFKNKLVFKNNIEDWNEI